MQQQETSKRTGLPVLSIARASKQQELFKLDPVLHARSNAEARNAYGNAAQIIVCERLGLEPIRINGKFDICFDAERPPFFFEIKSVRKGQKVVVYEWRIRKEVNSGVPVLYAILIHNLKGARYNIVAAMRASDTSILLVPANTIYRETRVLPKHIYVPKTTAQKRLGYARSGYADGYYNISINRLLSLPDSKLIT